MTGPARPARIRVTRQPGSTTTLEVEADGREVELEAEADGAMRRVIGRVAGPGVLRLRVEGRDELAGFVADVPPIVVREAARRLVWADLHGHSRYSDGTGEPADWFAYARDVAGLDAVALTDHDHWGVRPLAESPAHQADILASVRRFHEPGRFVTLPGYEWTSWLHGHRHVLYFEEPAPIFSAFDPETDRPDELWDALRGRPALTFAHHTAGEPVATNWRFAPDPELETLVEVASVHGVSEAADAPQPVEGGIPGHFARDALRRGYRLGFVGSGDSHDGHPGLAEIAAGRAGLAGIFTDALDRPALLDAMRRRHTFATNGIRPWLEVSLDGVAMGGELEASSDAPMHRLHVRYEATAPIARLDLVRSGHVLRLDPGELGLDAPDALDLAREIPVLGPGEFHYVRILQTDGGIAWSSPIFARAPQAPIQRLRNTKKAAPSGQSAARR
ncbi:MAG: CehA/McbA family metallohydrolase [Myxococcota bacterium]